MFQVRVVSPKHRLIKVDSQEFGRCKVPLSPVTIQEEPVSVFISLIFTQTHHLISLTTFGSVFPRWFPLPQWPRMLKRTTLTRLMPAQTQDHDQAGSPNLHQQTAAATWSHLRHSGSSQVITSQLGF